MRSVLLGANQTAPPSTFYAEEAYGHALAVGSDAEWYVAADQGNLWSLPMMFRPVKGEGWEAFSPYGYSGIYAHPSLGNAEVAEFWSATVDELRQRGVVSLFLRFPPYTYPGLDTEAFSGLPGLKIENISRTIEIPTDVGSDRVWAGMTGRARTAVRKAMKLGMTAEVIQADEQRLGEQSSFRHLYCETMQRIGAAAHHIYDSSYYSTLLSRLGERIHVVEVKNSIGEPAASAMILADENVVHYHLSGSNPFEARNGANNLLIWSILQWAAQHGYSTVHLGGGLTVGDSLYKFKESFGGYSRVFSVGRVVVDQARYDVLAAERAHVLGVSLSDLQESSFFPIFRAEL